MIFRCFRLFRNGFFIKTVSLSKPCLYIITSHYICFYTALLSLLPFSITKRHFISSLSNFLFLSFSLTLSLSLSLSLFLPLSLLHSSLILFPFFSQTLSFYLAFPLLFSCLSFTLFLSLSISISLCFRHALTPRSLFSYFSFSLYFMLTRNTSTI